MYKINLGDAIEAKTGKHPNKSKEDQYIGHLKKSKEKWKDEFVQYLIKNNGTSPPTESRLGQMIKYYFGLNPWDFSCFLHEREECNCFIESNGSKGV